MVSFRISYCKKNVLLAGIKSVVRKIMLLSPMFSYPDCDILVQNHKGSAIFYFIQQLLKKWRITFPQIMKSSLYLNGEMKNLNVNIMIFVYIWKRKRFPWKIFGSSEGLFEVLFLCYNGRDALCIQV